MSGAVVTRSQGGWGRTLALLMLILLLATACSSSPKVAAIAQPTDTPSPICLNAASSINPVQAENTCPGTTSWGEDHTLGKTHAIEAYTNPVSANVTEHVSIYVSTGATSYSYQIFRMGWYQGLGGRLMYTSPLIPGVQQAPPTIDPITHMVSCHWISPTTVMIPAEWVSGVYIVKLISSDGFMRYTSFTVRNDLHPATMLFQSSVLTYQAYNYWGGYSLYQGIDANGQFVDVNKAHVVSFDRPYAENAGLSDFVRFEYDLLRWVERQGYNISYVTDIDADLHPELYLHHKLVLVAGHDEYWSAGMRTTLTATRDSGISLGFFGANDAYWRVRLGASSLGPDREITCYRDYALDPIVATNRYDATVRWRDFPILQPESTILGEEYHGIVQQPAPMVFSTDAAPFLAKTDLQVGGSLPDLVGGEYDQVPKDSTAFASLKVLAKSPMQCTPSPLCPVSGNDVATTTIYTAPSGAHVFDAGTFLWSWGLDATQIIDFRNARPVSVTNTAFQQFTANLVEYLSGT